MLVAFRSDEAGNIGANNLTLSISLAEGEIQSLAARTATRNAAVVASTGTVAVISVGAVSATTIAAGEWLVESATLKSDQGKPLKLSSCYIVSHALTVCSARCCIRQVTVISSVCTCLITPYIHWQEQIHTYQPH